MVRTPSCSARRTSRSRAIGAILAARDLGLSVPQDVSVMGVDDHELAAFFGLSTVAQFPRRQGERAAEMILDDLHPTTREAADRNERVPFELIVRSSTARPITP